MAIFHLATGDRGHTGPVTSMDVLIVGTGPAGAALAAFLANYGMFKLIGLFETGKNTDKSKGIRGVMISSSPTNADTPRAHITNMAAMG